MSPTNQAEAETPPSRPTSRKRLTFFVARKSKKVTPERTGSVRRSQSVRRAASNRRTRPQISQNKAESLTSHTEGQDTFGIAESKNVKKVSSTQQIQSPPLAQDSQSLTAGQVSSISVSGTSIPPSIPRVDKREKKKMAQVATSSPPSQTRTGFIRRLTKKLKLPQGQSSNTPSPSNVPPLPPTPTTPNSLAVPAPPEAQKPKRKNTFKLPPLPRPQAPAPNLTNAFISPQSREAALRACGLVPARYRDVNGNMMPLSQQEKDLDMRYSVLAEQPGWEDEEEGESEAKRIREAWLKRNEENEVAEEEGRVSGKGLDVETEDENMVIGKGLSPRRPTIMLAHASALTSPSKAEFQDGEGRSIREGEVDPADIPLPPSPTLSAHDELNLPEMEEFTGAGESAEVDEKVSKWLESTPTAASFRKPDGKEEEGQEKGESPTTPSSMQSRKQRPPPIVTSSPTSSNPSSPRSEVSGLSPLPTSPPPDFEDPRSPRETLPVLSVSPPEPNIEQQRGRTLASPSAASQMPALSPTRTASSGTSEGPRTPITTSASPTHLIHNRMRKTSSASGSSGESRGRKPPVRRPTGNGLKDGPGLKIQTTELEDIGEGTQMHVQSAIVESPVEEKSLGMDEKPSEADVVRPRPRASTGDEVMERRRSITLGVFGRQRSPDARIGISARASSSMTSLRRNLSKLSARPRSSLIVDTTSANSNAGQFRSPTSPKSTSTLSATSPTHLRPRQPLSPTMHSRGSILMETKAIEDEESRRLSELAFLDF